MAMLNIIYSVILPATYSTGALEWAGNDEIIVLDEVIKAIVEVADSINAAVVELADTFDLKSNERKLSYRFKPGQRYFIYALSIDVEW